MSPPLHIRECGLQSASLDTLMPLCDYEPMPQTDEQARQDMADDIMELALWLRANPDLAPRYGTYEVTLWASYDDGVYDPEQQKQWMRDRVRRLGPAVKHPEESSMRVTKSFGAGRATFSLRCDREAVCRQGVKGKKPGVVLVKEAVYADGFVDDVEWECDPVLGEAQ